MGVSIGPFTLLERRLVSLSRFISAIAVFCAIIGFYAINIGALDNRKLALVLLCIPFFLGTVVLRNAPDVLFSLLVIGLSFSARFRLFGHSFHPGGAEVAIAPIDFPLFVLALLGILQLSKRPRVVMPQARLLFLPFFFFFAAHLLSLISATNHGLALLEIARLLKVILLVLVVCHYVDSRERIAFVTKIILLTVIFQGALAVIQSVFGVSLGMGFLGEHKYWVISKGGITIGRAGGTLGHANVLANFFELLTPIGLSFLLSGIRGHFRFLAACALSLGIIGTFLTSSRAGWASLGVGLALVVFLYRRRLLKKRNVLTLITAGSLVLGIGVVSGGIILARFTNFWEGSRVVRMITAETALNMLRSNPILGVGANNYLQVSSNYVTVPPTSGLYQTAAAVVHNVSLLYGAELGLVGLIAFIGLILAVMRFGYRIVRESDPFMMALATGLLSGMVALIAHGMWDWLFRYDPVFMLFWFVVGLLIAMRNVISKISIPWRVQVPSGSYANQDG